VYGSVIRIAPEAPVPVLKRESSIESAGMASNVARNLKSLGCNTTLCTNENFDIIRKTRYTESKSNHMFMRFDENDNSYGKCDFSCVEFEKYDCVIISDYNKDWLSQEQIEEIGYRSKLSFLDTKKILGSWAKTITYIKINENEYERTLDVIDKNLFSKLIITLGDKGAMHKSIHYPVRLVQKVDLAGAGDTFISGLAMKFVETNNIDNAIKFANECASIVVQKRGVSIVNDNLD